MMNRISIVTILGAALALSGLAAEADEMMDVVGAGNDFAVKLYRRLAGKEGNLFFSPASIHIALGMTYAGARNQTARQMAGTLQLDKTGSGVHSGFAALLKTLSSPRMVSDYEAVGKDLRKIHKPAYQLVVANALWGQKGYPWEKEFLDLTADSYGAGLHDVDFAQATEVARKTINSWIEKETKDRIRNLIPAGTLNALTRLVLTNAVYFKANWARDFSKRATEDKPFHVSATREINAPLMFQKRSFRYMETKTFQALEMPYKGRELVMVVFLPMKFDGLGQFEKSMTADRIDGWLEKLEIQEVEVTFPRFEFTSSFSLASTLTAMGMGTAFSGSADFSGMTSVEKIFISEVIHKSFVAVDEVGTEAAAATAVTMTLGTSKPAEKPKPKIFMADHPFLFLIRHNSLGLTLFIGRVLNPM